MKWKHGFGMLLASGILAGLAWGETLEMVTYYPAPAVDGGSGDFDRLHANRATIGEEYNRTNVPDADVPDGHLLVFDRVGIGTTAPAGPLHVVGADNAASSVVFMPGAGGTLNVGIGTANPISVLHAVGGPDDTANNITLDNYMDVANWGGELATRRSRGTPNAPAAVVDNDDLGGIAFSGYNGTSFMAGAGIGPQVDGAPNAGGVPTAVHISAYDGTTYSQRLTIRADGNVGIGTTTPQTTSPANNQATGNLDVNDVFLRSTNQWLSQGGGAAHAAKMVRTTAQSIPSGTWTKILFNSAPVNVGGMANTANSRFVIQQSGVYLVTGYVVFDYGFSGSTVSTLRIFRNGSPVSEGRSDKAPSSPVATAALVTDVLALNAGDRIEMYVNQGTAPSSNTLTGALDRPRCSVVQIQ